MVEKLYNFAIQAERRIKGKLEICNEDKRSESEYGKMRFSMHPELTMVGKLSLSLVWDRAASEEVVCFFHL